MGNEILYEVKGPKLLGDMTARELAAALKTTDIALIAFGALENHSTHLPLGSDNFQGEELIKRTSECLRKRGLPAVPAFCAPFGVHSNRFERDAPFGDISLTQATFIKMAVELVLSLAATGFKRFVFIPGHTENFAAMHVAAKDLGDLHGIPVIVVNWIPPMRDEWPKFVKNKTHQGHGGEDETAHVMAVVPNLVDLSDVGVYHPPEDANPVKCDDLCYYGGAVGIYTPVMKDGSPGFTGNPADATAKTGDISYDKCSEWIADIVCKFWGKQELRQAEGE